MFELLLILVLVLVAYGTRRVRQTFTHKHKHKHIRDRRARYVRIRRNRPGLEVAELQVYDAQNVNIGPFAELHQSSIRNNDAVSYGPMIAVNGNISGWAVGELASTSLDDANPWLLLDLGKSVALSRVTLFLRDKSSHPNPNDAWYPTKDNGACVEILNQNRDVLWVHSIDEWKWIYDFALYDIN